MAKRRHVIVLIVGIGLTVTAAGLMAAGSSRPVAVSPINVTPPVVGLPPPEVGFPEQASLAGTGGPDASTAAGAIAARLAVRRLTDEGVALHESGQVSGALAKFEQAMAADGTDQVSRRNLALTKAQVAWGYLEAGGYADALRTFAEADRVQPGEGGILQGLGVAHYKLGNVTQAEVFLERALDADPNLVPALTLRGEIAYRRDDLEDAGASFARAFRLDPSDAVVRDRLERVRTDAGARAGLRTLEGRHFTVRFEGPDAPDAMVVAQDVLRRLESAYREVGRQWGVFPEGRVPVVLYRDGTFRDPAVTPGWAQGMFDGTIWIPVGGAAHRADRLEDAVRHEYTHALVHARTRGNVPTWLSEGLAIVAENRDASGAHEVMRNAGRLIPLPELHRSFLTLPSTQVPLAYAESEAAVRYLLARHGEAAVRTLLRRLGEAREFAAAIEEVTGGTYAEFQSVWIRRIRDARKADG